jgi:hypothetical protein
MMMINDRFELEDLMTIDIEKKPGEFQQSKSGAHGAKCPEYILSQKLGIQRFG